MWEGRVCKRTIIVLTWEKKSITMWLHRNAQRMMRRPSYPRSDYSLALPKSRLAIIAWHDKSNDHRVRK